MPTFIHHDLPKLERTDSNQVRLYKTPSGRAYPSITTITGLHSKQGILEWRKRVGEAEANRISSQASKRGTKVHGYCESYLRSELCEPDTFDSEIFGRIRPYLEKIDNIHALETPLYSDHLEVAGTVDCIAEYEGKISVIDFKTSSKPKTRDHIHGYFMQTAAYAVAFEELTGIPVGRLVIIMGIDDNPTKIFVEKRDDWIDGFKSLRLEYKSKHGI